MQVKIFVTAILELWNLCLNPDSNNPDINQDYCSGNGKCECGTCKCSDFGQERTITGMYCECDTNYCPLAENSEGVSLPCAGNGECNCQNHSCDCKPGFKDADCACADRYRLTHTFNMAKFGVAKMMNPSLNKRPQAKFRYLCRKINLPFLIF